MFNRNPGGIVTKTEVGNYLRDAHGYALNKLQDETTIAALQNPETFITTRQTHLNELYKDDSEMVKYYVDAYAKFTKADFGLPPQQAHELASEAAEAIRETNIKALEMKYPGGYAKAMGIATTKHNAKMAIAGRADGELLKDADAQIRAEIRAELKGKYRAKKVVYKQKYPKK